ncbi:uncharacterized protein LOC123539293 [Mercenaria mercenaria]|uniref:uncharacterized protein LOC123539293 n=1 Tax=Mercenaria mercenaria TaxID=6596 RepID=UPI00234EA431|nr:uncharacterized protein LOC123539293 [Mercenaria mercenaria]
MKFILHALCGLTYLLGGCFCSLDDSIILFTDTQNRGLYGVSSKTGIPYSVAVKRILNPIAIHYNELNELIYWSDVSLKEIRSTSLSGHDDVTLRVLDNSSIPDGLAIDSISRLLFYTDVGNHLIALMELDGSNHAVVVSKDCDQPRAIVLDPMKGRIFWSDWGKFPKIETANYDGSERKALITTGILWPNALAIDFADQLMYWGDAGTHYIERSKIDGSGRKILYYDARAHFFSMLLYSDKLFYTDWQQRSVMALPVSGAENGTAVGNGSFARLNDISRLKQKPMYPRTNACSKNKGGCSHICIPRPKGEFACLCPTGFHLKDNTYCTKAHPSDYCQPLNPQNFTTISPNDCMTHPSPVGKVCTVECMDDFVYDGCKTELLCEENGQWSDQIHRCIDVSRPVIHNCPYDWQVFTAGKGKDTVTIEWPEMHVTDNSGIAPDVYSSMKSGITLHEGEYTVNIFAVDHVGHFTGCEFTFIIKVHRCGAISIPEHGYILSGWCLDYYGAKCKIACNTGYQLSSNTEVANIECNIDQSNKTMWTGNDLLCHLKTCPPITSPNTLVTGCSHPLNTGSVCEQTCSEGFERMHGTSVRVCKPDGSWSGQDLVCKEKSVECQQLPPLPGVLVFGCSPPYTIGSICEQTCNAGYKPEYPVTGVRVCKQDGTWSGHDINCMKYDGRSNNTPKSMGETDTGKGVTDTSIIIAGLLIVVSLMLINFGIFIHLKKLGGNYQAREASRNEKEATVPPTSSSS